MNIEYVISCSMGGFGDLYVADPCKFNIVGSVSNIDLALRFKTKEGLLCYVNDKCNSFWKNSYEIKEVSNETES